MEHRFGNRRAIVAAVVLHPRGALPVAGQTREISISGMFVDITPGPFAANSVIDVEFSLQAAAGLRSYHWQAMVIRTTESGVGLMFDRLRPPGIVRLLASADAGLPQVVTAQTRAGNVVPLRATAEKVQAQL